MDKKYLFQQLFSLIGDKSEQLYPYLSIKAKKKVQDFLKTPMLPNNSVELEQLLSYFIEKTSTNASTDLDNNSVENVLDEDVDKPVLKETENLEETDVDDNTPASISSDSRVIKLSEQSPQLIAFYLNNIDEEKANYYKTKLDSSLLSEVNKVIVEPMPTDKHIFSIIHNTIESD